MLKRTAMAIGKAQGLVEYSLIIVLVTLIVLVLVVLLGPPVGNMFSTVVANI